MPDSSRSIHRRQPVLVFYAYRITQSAAFTIPIFILFFRSRGLSFAQIGLIEAVYTVTVLLCETPTGYIGDRIGHRRSMLLGTLLSAAGALGYVGAQTFPMFVVVAGLRGVATTFRSGTTEAWLYELLGTTDTHDRFTEISGRASAATTGVHGLAALLGSVLYGLDHLLPWILEAAVVGAGVPLVIALPTIDSETKAQSDANSPSPPKPTGGQGRPDIRSMLRLIRGTLRTRTLGPFVLYTALLFGLINTLEMFIQPASVSVVGLAPESLGGLYAGLTGFAAVLASQSGRIKHIIGIGRWFVLAPTILAIGLLTIPAVPWLALPVFALHRAIGAVSRPLTGQYINDHTPIEGRATVLSAASMIRSVVTAPLNTIGGAIAAAIALPLTLGVLGGVLLIGTLGILFWRFPVTAGTIPDQSGE